MLLILLLRCKLSTFSFFQFYCVAVSLIHFIRCDLSHTHFCIQIITIEGELDVPFIDLRSIQQYYWLMSGLPFRLLCNGQHYYEALFQLLMPLEILLTWLQISFQYCGQSWLTTALQLLLAAMNHSALTINLNQLDFGNCHPCSQRHRIVTHWNHCFLVE